METNKSIKYVFFYLVILTGTLANLMFWTDSRPAPVWMLILGGLESLALLIFWFGQFVFKKSWAKSSENSAWIVFWFLALRSLALPFVAAA